MIFFCQKCGHIWLYRGNRTDSARCPKCHAWVNLKTQRVDRHLFLSNHQTAQYLAATKNSILYYQPERGHLIEYNGAPNPYSNCKITPVKPEQLQDHLKNIHWERGLMFIRKYIYSHI